MNKLSVDDMLKGKTSRYALAIAVAKRAREITEQSILNGEAMKEKAVNLAVQDIEDGKYIIIQPD